MMRKNTPDSISNYDRVEDRVIRVFLDTDTYEVTKSGGTGADYGYGISVRASEWFRNYALRGYVHEEDLAAYLLFTELHALREMGTLKKENRILRFRRKIGQRYRASVLEIRDDPGSTDAQPVIQIILGTLE